MGRAHGRALWLPDVLRDAGLPIRVWEGWEWRGNDPIEWIAQVNHHTASGSGSAYPSLGTVRFGRPDVPGPLSNTLPDRNGVIHIIAAGAANHPGVSYLPLRGGISSGVKYWSLGHEIELNGVGEPFDGVQYENVHVMNAAICTYLGLDPISTLFDHKSICVPRGRKIDVNPYSLAAGRTYTAQIMMRGRDWLSMASLPEVEAVMRRVVKQELAGVAMGVVATHTEVRKNQAKLNFFEGMLKSARAWSVAHAKKQGVTSEEAMEWWPK